MNRASSVVVVAAVAAALSVASPQRSFAGLEFVPFMGVLHPTETLVTDRTSPIFLEVTSATAYGARATWWTSPRIGIEGSLAVAAPVLRLVSSALLESSGSVLFADARARFRLTKPGSPAQFDVIGGIGITHSRWSVDEFFEPTGLEHKDRVQWVLGLGATVDVFQNAGLRFELEDHIFNTPVEVDPAMVSILADDRGQHDLLWTIGLVVPFGSK